MDQNLSNNAPMHNHQGPPQPPAEAAQGERAVSPEIINRLTDAREVFKNELRKVIEQMVPKPPKREIEKKLNESYKKLSIKQMTPYMEKADRLNRLRVEEFPDLAQLIRKPEKCTTHDSAQSSNGSGAPRPIPNSLQSFTNSSQQNLGDVRASSVGSSGLTSSSRITPPVIKEDTAEAQKRRKLKKRTTQDSAQSSNGSGAPRPALSSTQNSGQMLATQRNTNPAAPLPRVGNQRQLLSPEDLNLIKQFVNEPNKMVPQQLMILQNQRHQMPPANQATSIPSTSQNQMALQMNSPIPNSLQSLTNPSQQNLGDVRASSVGSSGLTSSSRITQPVIREDTPEGSQENTLNTGSVQRYPEIAQKRRKLKKRTTQDSAQSSNGSGATRPTMSSTQNSGQMLATQRNTIPAAPLPEADNIQQFLTPEYLNLIKQYPNQLNEMIEKELIRMENQRRQMLPANQATSIPSTSQNQIPHQMNSPIPNSLQSFTNLSQQNLDNVRVLSVGSSGFNASPSLSGTTPLVTQKKRNRKKRTAQDSAQSSNGSGAPKPVTFLTQNSGQMQATQRNTNPAAPLPRVDNQQQAMSPENLDLNRFINVCLLQKQLMTLQDQIRQLQMLLDNQINDIPLTTLNQMLLQMNIPIPNFLQSFTNLSQQNLGDVRASSVGSSGFNTSPTSSRTTPPVIDENTPEGTQEEKKHFHQ